MRIAISHRCADFNSYRAAAVKSMFNCEDGFAFDLTAELPIEETDWSVGLVVGPSGSGKTSIGRKIFGKQAMYRSTGWPKDLPIIDAIDPAGEWRDVAGALSAVGLGSVPAWLRPYHVLSNGEKFRADLAKIICSAPGRVVIDEFSSVVDRQIARIGAMAFGRAWRRTGGKSVLLSCHYDIAEWLDPDWTFDTATGKFSGRGLHRRPEILLDLFETNWRFWPLFEPHYYLRLPKMIAADCYVGFVDNEPVAHLAVSPMPGMKLCRASRLVVMPEWQGAGVGIKFLQAVAERWRAGENRYRKPMRLIFHTSHPGLASALRRQASWRQSRCSLHGEKGKARSAASIKKSGGAGTGYGGHFRVVQGFSYEPGET